MKVLYCILDNRCGGPHRRAHQTALRLREDGIETVFLVGYKGGQTWRPDGFQAFVFPRIQCFMRSAPVRNFLRFWWSLPRNLWRMRRIIKSHGIDIVHVDGVTNFVPALAAGLSGVPIVWLYNDPVPGPLRPLLLSLVTSLSAVVVVQSEKLKESRAGDRPRLYAKTTVLHSGVDIRTFDPDRYGPQQKDRTKRDLGIPSDCVVVGTIGNLNYLKGHAYFIRAARRIKETVGSVRFLVVGRKLDTDPGYWKRLQRLTAENGLEDDLIYAGFQSDVPSILAVMDVFVLASILESCPMVVLEAMAMKVPVVATDVGAVAEMVENGRSGTVVPVGDADAIARAAADYLTQPPERVRAVTDAARKRVEAAFALDRIACRQKHLYDAVNRRRRSRA